MYRIDYVKMDPFETRNGIFSIGVLFVNDINGSRGSACLNSSIEETRETPKMYLDPPFNQYNDGKWLPYINQYFILKLNKE